MDDDGGAQAPEEAAAAVGEEGGPEQCEGAGAREGSRAEGECGDGGPPERAPDAFALAGPAEADEDDAGRENADAPAGANGDGVREPAGEGARVDAGADEPRAAVGDCSGDAEPSNQVENAGDDRIEKESKDSATEDGKEIVLKEDVSNKLVLKREIDAEIDPKREMEMKSLGPRFSWETQYDDGDESGTEEEQYAFRKEVETFYKGRSLEFKAPKFYKEELNLLKLYRAVVKLGGYEQVPLDFIVFTVANFEKFPFLLPMNDVFNQNTDDALYNKSLANTFPIAPGWAAGQRCKLHIQQQFRMYFGNSTWRPSVAEWLKRPKSFTEELCGAKARGVRVELGHLSQVVTSCKLWRQVGAPFRPPKTCTTVSWTFRNFYEKALLEYEKYRMQCGELPFFEYDISIPKAENQVGGNHISQASTSGRALRDAAARAMQGWHSQSAGNAEVSTPIVKDGKSSFSQKSDKQIKSGLLKRKKTPAPGNTGHLARTKALKPQLNSIVIDVGPPADWVKINVYKINECFEVYALVPGLLREEVHVQSDPAGRLIISGQPQQLDNPWGVTPFKKVVSLPSRIDPHQTSAVVTLNGQLFVRVPCEQKDL